MKAPVEKTACKEFERFVERNLEAGKEIRHTTLEEFLKFSGLTVAASSFYQYQRGILGNYMAGPRIHRDTRKKYAHLLKKKDVIPPNKAVSKKVSKPKALRRVVTHTMVAVVPAVAPTVPTAQETITPPSYQYGTLATQVKDFVCSCHSQGKPEEEMTYIHFCSHSGRQPRSEEEAESYAALQKLFFNNVVLAADADVNRSASVFNLLLAEPDLTNLQVMKRLGISMHHSNFTRIRAQIKRGGQRLKENPSKRLLVEGVLRKNPAANSTMIQKALPGIKVEKSYIRAVTREFFRGGQKRVPKVVDHAESAAGSTTGSTTSTMIPVAEVQRVMDLSAAGAGLSKVPADRARPNLYRTLDFVSTKTPIGDEVLRLVDTILAAVSAETGSKFSIVHTKHPQEGLELRVSRLAE